MSRTLIALSLAAATLAGAASAQANISYFSLAHTLESGSTLELGTVRAAADGVVELYDTHGNFLGSSEVTAGANTNVRVFVGHPPLTDVRAELKVGGQTVAEQVYDIAR